VWTFAYNGLGQGAQYVVPEKGDSPVSFAGADSRATVPFSSTDAVLFGLAYTLNDGGNITREDHNDASYWLYGYDNRDRLTGAERRNNLGDSGTPK